MNLKPSFKLGSQKAVLILTIQMSALLLCSVKNSYFILIRHCTCCSNCSYYISWCWGMRIKTTMIG